MLESYDNLLYNRIIKVLGGKKLTQEKIQRINELSRKSKVGGLTSSEKEEQNTLRKEYLEDVKHNFRNTLNNIVVVDENGNKTKINTLQR